MGGGWVMFPCMVAGSGGAFAALLLQQGFRHSELRRAGGRALHTRWLNCTPVNKAKTKAPFSLSNVIHTRPQSHQSMWFHGCRWKWDKWRLQFEFNTFDAHILQNVTNSFSSTDVHFWVFLGLCVLLLPILWTFNQLEALQVNRTFVTWLTARGIFL